MLLGMGPFELAFIAGIALVIIGPEKFPEFAKICMRTVRDLRSYMEEAKHDLRKEIDPLKKEINEVKNYDPEKYIDALTDSRDEKDYYDEGYGYGEDQDGDYEAYDMYGADDGASATSEQTGEGEAPADATETPAPQTDEEASDADETAGEGAEEAEESAKQADAQAAPDDDAEPDSPREEDFDIPKPMDG